MTMLKKSFRFEVKEIDEKGTFIGYASIFGNVDEHGDVVEKGAFKRTLDHSGGQVPVLWQHDMREPIGIGVELVEDEKGLRVNGVLNLDTQRGREAYSLLKQGALKGLSIGYSVIKDSVEKGIRYLKELRLWEFSLVTFPANLDALVSDVKGDKQEDTFKTIKALLSEMTLFAKSNHKEPGRNVSDPDIHSLMETMKSIRNYAQGG